MAVIVTWNGEEVKKRAEALAGKSSFEIGLAVQAQAKALCPVAKVNGGRLRGSITTASGLGRRTNPEGNGAVASDKIAAPSEPFETFVGTPVFYGPYVEYGTFRMSAQPFLRPALDMVRGKAVQIVQVEAKKAFQEYLNPKAIFSQTNEAFSE